MNLLYFFKKNPIRNLVILLVLGNILLIILASFFLSSNFPEVNSKEILNYKKEYSPAPIYNQGLTSSITIKYPFLKTPPWDFRYLFVPSKEENIIQTKKYDHFFYADKRIAELLKWGESIPANGVKYNNSRELVASLKESWRLQKIKNYNSWEAVLARYIEHVENVERELISQIENKHLDKSREVADLLSRLQAHRLDLNTFIDTTKKSNDQKKYLHKLVDAIQDHLSKNILLVLPQYNPHAIYYSISDIINEKEYAIYDVFVSNNSGTILPPKDVTLTIRDRTYKPSLIDNSENELVYKDVKIEPSRHFSILKDVSLVFPAFAQLKNLKWQTRPEIQNTYYIDIPVNRERNSFYVKFRSPVKSFYYLKLEKHFTVLDERGNNILKIESYFAQPFNTSADREKEVLNTYDSLIQLRDDSEDSAILHIAIESSVPLSPNELQSTSIELVPRYDTFVMLRKTKELEKRNPIITHTKVNLFTYQLNFKNTSLTEEKYTTQSLTKNWLTLSDKSVKTSNGNLRRISLIDKQLFFLFIVCALFNTVIIGFMLYFGTKNVYRLDRPTFIYSWLKKLLIFRYPLPLIVFGGLVGDVFFSTTYSDFIVLFLSLCWIGILLMHKLDSRTSFTLAILSLLSIPFFAFYKYESVAEKLGVWSFIFLLIGSAHAFIEIKDSSKGHYFSFTKFLKGARSCFLIVKKILSYPILTPIASFVRRLILSLRVVELVGLANTQSLKLIKNCRFLFNKMITLAKATFSFHPRTFTDLIWILLKYLILIVVLFVLFFSFQKAYFFFENIQRETAEEKRRESLNPQVTKVEPQIVYFATRVIISGKRLGWKEDKNVKLITKQGPISADLWTDTKIVFTVPLHLKPGKIDLWIEKTVIWKGKSITVKSKTSTLKLLPRSNKFTSDDDAYFEQLKTLNKETLRLNGYKPEDYR